MEFDTKRIAIMSGSKQTKVLFSRGRGISHDVSYARCIDKNQSLVLSVWPVDNRHCLWRCLEHSVLLAGCRYRQRFILLP